MTEKIGKILRYIFIGVLYLVILFYTIIFNNSTGWGLLFFLTFFLVFNLLSLLPSLKTIQPKIEETLFCHVNEKRQLEVALQKQQPTTFPIPRLCVRLRSTFFPIPEINISYRDDYLKETQVLHFYTGTKATISLNWMPKIRGFYQDLPIDFQASDLFDFFIKNQENHIKTDIVILPEVDPQAALLVPIIRSQQQQAAFGDARFAIKNYRPYHPGDPLKYIDWKLSGKQRELMFREHETEEESSLSLVFWGCPSKYFEKTLSIYFSLQEELRKTTRFTQYLLGEGIDYPDRIEAKNFALIQPSKSVPVIPALHNQQLFIFAPEMSDELLQQVAVLRKSNTVIVYNYEDLKAFLLASENQLVKGESSYA